ncbi:MAG TPA: Fic family protein [Solirubrobacterales bacterium]|nr:Fic family protein [Solirubrobacterales bacterium]
MAASHAKRKYEETHPWLTFKVDLKGADFRLWLLLGEATSKSDHVRRALLRPEVAAEMLTVFLVKGALATTAIEGNTLSEEEARQIFENELRLPPSKEYLAQEIQNIIGAFNRIRDEILPDAANADLTVEKIKLYNRLVLDGLEVDDDVEPGEIRKHSVVVGRYRGAPAQDCEHLLKRLCEWLNSDAFKAPEDEPELAPPLAILRAVLAHLYLTWIHPFGDGNGRTARLLELHILLASGFPQPVTQLLSNHYNHTRSEYYRQLDRTTTAGPNGFLLYAVQGFVDELRSQLDRIWAMQYVDRWEQYVHQRFGETNTDARRRQLRLVKDLSKASIEATPNHPVPNLRAKPRAEIRRLSPELAEAYAGKTERSLTRDLNALERMELIRRTPEGWIPRSDSVLAFMPLQARSSDRDSLVSW